MPYLLLGFNKINTLLKLIIEPFFGNLRDTRVVTNKQRALKLPLSLFDHTRHIFANWLLHLVTSNRSSPNAPNRVVLLNQNISIPDISIRDNRTSSSMLEEVIRHDVSKHSTLPAVNCVNKDYFVLFDIRYLLMQMIIGARMSKHILNFTNDMKT